MRSISFPSMFGTTNTKVEKDSHKATYQNLMLLLGSEKGEFISDPYFGVRLRRYLYEQNNFVLRDVLIDEIYTQIKVFMPQLEINRKDITLVAEKDKISCNIKTINKLDFEVDSYNLVLLSGEDEQ